MADFPKDRHQTKVPIISSLLICVFLIIGGAYFADRQLQNAREASFEHLQMIAKVKVDQVDRWLMERKGDAEVISSAGSLVNNYLRWIERGDEAARGRLVNRLEQFRRAYGYLRIALVSDSGEVLVSTGAASQAHAAPLVAAISRAASSRQVENTDLYRDAADSGRMRFDLVVGFNADNVIHAGAMKSPFLIVLQADTREFLFPFLLALPLQSDTAEVLLLHQKDQPERILNQPRLAVGNFIGLKLPDAGLLMEKGSAHLPRLDYRGKEVLAAELALAEMPWRLIVKEDLSEVYQKFSWELLSIIIATIGLVFMALIGNVVRYQRQRLQQSAFENEQQAQQLKMQADLQESNQRFTDIAHASKDWIWETDAAGIYFTYVSDTVTESLGYTPEELLKIRVRDLVPKDEQDRVIQFRQECREKRMPFLDFEHPLLHKDGSRRIVMTNGVPIVDQEGNLRGYRGTDRDITTKRDKEETIRRLSLAVEQGINGILIANLEYEIEYVNDAYCRHTGYTREELIGQRVRFNASGLTSQGTYDQLDDALKNGKVWRGRFYNHTKSGELCIDEAVISPLRQPTGEITHYVGIYEDITELERQREELERYREHLQELVEQRTKELAEAKSGAEQASQLLREAVDVSAQGFVIFDQDDRLLLCNDYYRECFPEVSHLIVPGIRFVDLLRAAIERDVFVFEEGLSGEQWLGERMLAHQGRDGSPIESQLKCGRWLLTMEFRTPSGYYVGNRVDITEIKNGEQLLAEARDQANSANQAKSLFLANMSHEIRSPMNAIIGLSHLCLKTELPSKSRDYVLKVQKAATQLLGIINDILDFSKIEAGKMQIEQKPFMLEDVIGYSADLFRVSLAERGVQFNVRIASEVPVNLIGDSLRLGQVLTNLLSNASKFTEQGSIDLEVFPCALLADSDQAVELMFSVRDSGIGMTAEQQGKLFREFSQVDSSITRRFGGTGLGLTICRQLIELMGGRISLESAVGRGTCFSFSLRFQLAPSLSVANGQIRMGQVLIVDDDPIARAMLQRVLEKFGFAVTSAESGAAALRAITVTPEHFSLIVLDWKMPGMDGIETCQRIRSMSGYQATPVIMLTAATTEDLDAMGAHGVDHFLFKPIQASLLFDTLMDALGAAPPHRAHEASSSQPLAGCRILLVEDNEFNQEVARELLSADGALLTIASDGQNALDILGRQSFDIVLMDIQMPVMDGITATQAIRCQSRFDQLPIIAMTANALLEERQRCIDVGMNDFVTKPINPESLSDTVAAWLPRGVEAANSKALPNESVRDNEPLPSFNEAVTDVACASHIDLEIGLGFVKGNKPLYVRLLNSFLKNQEALAAQLNQGVSNNELQLVLRSAHTLRGIAGTLGAVALSDAAAGLEVQLKEGESLGNAVDWIRALQTELDLTKSEAVQLAQSLI